MTDWKKISSLLQEAAGMAPAEWSGQEQIRAVTMACFLMHVAEGVSFPDRDKVTKPLSFKDIPFEQAQPKEHRIFLRRMKKDPVPTFLP